MTSKIQAVLFDKRLFTTAQARQWLRKNDLRAMKVVHITERYLRYRIEDPNQFRRFSTKKLSNGVEALDAGPFRRYTLLSAPLPLMLMSVRVQRIQNFD